MTKGIDYKHDLQRTRKQLQVNFFNMRTDKHKGNCIVLFGKNLRNLREFFGQIIHRLLWQKNCPLTL